MKYVLQGKEQAIRNVIKENRIRIKRGLISITPLADAVEEPVKVEEDSKDVENVDSKAVDDEDSKEVIVEDSKKVAEDDAKEPAKETKTKSKK